MRSETKMTRACLALIMTAMLAACGGSGGGDNDGLAPIDPVDPPGTTYLVSGSVNGLVGAVQISDGFQTLDVSVDGGFAFAHGYARGDTFDVTVDTGTTDQLCTVTRGAGIVLDNIDDVSIDCLEVREVNVRVVKPEHYERYDELNLRSSYQFIPQLAGETARLVVARNQFISVSTSDEQALPLYAAFVKSFDDIVVDSQSTAIALMLLNPSIHNAIEERQSRFDDFATRLASLPAVTALADAIKRKADAGQFNLSAAPAADLLPLLDAAVVASASEIVSSGAVAAKPAASTQYRAAQKLQVTPTNGTQDGVSLVLEKITPDASGNNYQLQISNNQQRYIAIESPLLTAPIALPPGGSQSQLLQSSGIDSVLLKVFGPGDQAATAPVPASLKQAVIDTAGEFYTMPSLTFTTGRLNGLGLRLFACIEAETLQQIRDEANTALLESTTLDSALQSPNHTAAYDAVTVPLRASIVSNLEALMQCDFFRAGRWLDEHAGTARAQIGLMLNIEQAWHAPRLSGPNVLVSQGLLTAGAVIKSSMTEQQWQLSNKLAVVVKQTKNGTASTVEGNVITINEGETLALEAGCVDPLGGAAVACNVQWSTPEGTTTSSIFNQIMTASAILTVSAADEDGASASRTIAVTVVALPPQSASYWTQQDATSSRRFDVNAITVTPDTSGIAGENVTQIRGFSDATAYPMISISLPHFNGAGSYMLDDLMSGTGCLGNTLLPARQSAQLWCTKTAANFETSPTTGTAIYAIDAQGKHTVDFDFHVVPAECVIPSDCAHQYQHITGHIELP